MSLSRGLVRLLALTCAVTAANLYYAQPLLHSIARSLGTSQSAAGLLVTATQLGYAAGLLFVVPLGDIVARRPLFSALLAVDAVALAVSAAAPNLTLLGSFAALIGITSVVIQMVIPYAATLAADTERGRVIGTLMGALLLGVLLSRTVAGLLASVATWRGVFGFAAGLMVITAIVLRRVLPADQRELRISYGAQMHAVLQIARTQPVLRWRSFVGAMAFAAFSAFWTTVTFLLSGPHYRYSQAEIGLFALVGAAGAGAALFGGRLLDSHRHLRWHVTGIGLALLVGSFGLLGAGTHGLVWLIFGALIMDGCIQAVHITNQAVVYDLVPAARSRITTIYMTAYFLGGAAGSTVGTQAYDRYGWGGACGVAAGFCVLGLLGWIGTRRHETADARLPVPAMP